ncbi:hypothetical protein R83H12_01377 [Fibrobacteria bacterium R8-3-H12]
MIEALSKTSFTEESYLSFLENRAFAINHVERDKVTTTFFDTIEKTDFSQNEEGKELINFLKSRI